MEFTPPPVRGRLTANAPLAPLTWFQTGGAAEYLFRPADADDLAALLRAVPMDVPLTLLGAGSNVLIRDGGIKGIVIKLGRGFTAITATPDGYAVGAAALDQTLAQTAAADGRAGLEFLIGIPGSIGGAVRMNAGCYGREISDIIVYADVMHRSGDIERLDKDALGLSYRHSNLPKDTIVLSAHLRTEPGDKAAITARLAEIRSLREETQPTGSRTGGSTFANPLGHKAWALIDAAGCRGLTRGGAMVSEKHCNFLINTGGATAADIEALGETVRERVLQQSGITLRWEIERIGLSKDV